jgi:hypothetical protein
VHLKAESFSVIKMKLYTIKKRRKKESLFQFGVPGVSEEGTRKGWQIMEKNMQKRVQQKREKRPR